MCGIQPSTRFVTPHVPRHRCIQGVGGLGHLGVQFARKMACAPWRLVGARQEHLAQKSERTLHDARHKTRRQHCKSSEAQKFILRPRQAAPQSVLASGLKTRANLWLSESQAIIRSTAYAHLRRTVSFRVSPKSDRDSDTLDFSVLTDVRPMIETLRLQKPRKHTNEDDGKARFRVVLTMTKQLKACGKTEHKPTSRGDLMIHSRNL